MTASPSRMYYLRVNDPILSLDGSRILARSTVNLGLATTYYRWAMIPSDHSVEVQTSGTADIKRPMIGLVFESGPINVWRMEDTDGMDEDDAVTHHYFAQPQRFASDERRLAAMVLLGQGSNPAAANNWLRKIINESEDDIHALSRAYAAQELARRAVPPAPVKVPSKR